MNATESIMMLVKVTEDSVDLLRLQLEGALDRAEVADRKVQVLRGHAEALAALLEHYPSAFADTILEDFRRDFPSRNGSPGR